MPRFKWLSGAGILLTVVVRSKRFAAPALSRMESESGERYDVDIPVFLLDSPHEPRIMN